MAKSERVTQGDINAMKRLRVEGHTNSQIADIMGWSHQTVMNYIGRQTVHNKKQPRDTSFSQVSQHVHGHTLAVKTHKRKGDGVITTVLLVDSVIRIPLDGFDEFVEFAQWAKHEVDILKGANAT